MSNGLGEVGCQASVQFIVWKSSETQTPPGEKGTFLHFERNLYLKNDDSIEPGYDEPVPVTIIAPYHDKLIGKVLIDANTLRQTCSMRLVILTAPGFQWPNWDLDFQHFLRFVLFSGFFI